MGLSWKEWNRKDIIYGVIAPILVVLLIVAISRLRYLFGGDFGVILGITMEVQELLLIGVIPLFLGLIWNRWAGGASGFLLGTVYALYWAPVYRGLQGSGPILLGYILSAMLIGYMAGALSRHSENLSRLIISGTVATTIGGVMLFGIFHLSPVNVVTGTEGFLITVFGRTACGVLIPIIAKVCFWYGISMPKNK